MGDAKCLLQYTFNSLADARCLIHILLIAFALICLCTESTDIYLTPNVEQKLAGRPPKGLLAVNAVSSISDVLSACFASQAKALHMIAMA